ncbi:hypothetical protein [Brachybacterium sacelli]|uniref:ABC transporter permease n=1 Tax=Brachybacterium sacelli TaxID=173364 RepID=A0ABS4WZ42_9MICO|nr:hypothetical protein [Brachybacterium sacelli]MBP2381467.1 hypothetical protein [Brachybacterium sacelli]
MPNATERSPLLGLAAALTFIIGIMGAVGAWRVDAFLRRWGTTTVRQALPRAAASRGRAVRDSAVVLWRNVTAQNWSEVRPEDFTTKRLEGLRGYFGLYIVLFLTLLAVATLGGMTSVLMGNDISNAAFAASVSLNAVLIASHAVLSALLMMAVLWLFRAVSLIQVSLSPGRALRTAAEAVGWGTAGGALFGALVPLLITFEPVAILFGAGSDGGAIYEPNIIVKLSAIGAVGGLLFGAAMIPSLVLPSAENLLYRRLLGPVVYCVIIGITSLSMAPIGRTGRELLDMNSSILGLDGVRCDAAAPGGVDLAKQSVVLELVDECGGELLLPDTAVVWSIVPLVLGIAFVLVINDLRRKRASM